MNPLYTVNIEGRDKVYRIFKDLEKQVDRLETDERKQVDEIVSGLKSRITQRLRGKVGNEVNLETEKKLWSTDT